MNTYSSQVELLTNTLIFETAKELALPHAIIKLLLGKVAERFAQIAVQLDQIIETKGAVAGAQWLLPKFVKSYSANGVENIPQQGPLIIACNHLGSYDAMVISAFIKRPDYKLIIGEIPFFKQIPNISKNAIFTAGPKDVDGRMRAVREIIRHLKNNGAILIFARGAIEADPDISPNADAEFHLWSRSLEIFINQVPQTQVLITIISGVIAKSSMTHPITWFRKARPDKQRIAYFYQILRQILTGKELYGLTPHVTFGKLISLKNTKDKEHILQTIIHSAHIVLRTHMAHV